MQVVIAQVIGVLVFLLGSVWLARVIRRSDAGGTAEKASRISHTLFWVALVLPGLAGLFHPGLRAYDDLFGLPGLPLPSVWFPVGVVLLAAGLVLMAGSNRFLIRKGRGAAAFLLTQQLVTDGLYGRTRNPMSLGFYAACAGIGMIAGSLIVTLAVLLVIVPVHLFNLKYFEERELELRYGPSYVEYRQRVPFLLPRIRST